MPEVMLHQWEISPFCGNGRKLLRHKGIAFPVRHDNGPLASKASGLCPAGNFSIWLRAYWPDQAILDGSW